MNHFQAKSLSDSSTSESEDDFTRRRASHDTWSGMPRVDRSQSTDHDTEDEPENLFYKMASQNTEIKKPVAFIKRTFSTDDTEDENVDGRQSKKFKDDLSVHAQMLERKLANDYTDSETDDKGSSMDLPFKSQMDSLSGNYGKGAKMIEKMGYKVGQGLGKYQQGRVDIVEASRQKGRRGLGLTMPGLEPSDEIWDPEINEEVSLHEDIDWIPPSNQEIPTNPEMRGWMLEGDKKEVISDEVEFCDPDILKKVLTYKSVFDRLEPEEMRKARTRSNPFETIRGGIFLNRAAMKMANMDYAFDHMFTNPKKKNGESAVGKHELLYFADVCAGPGGFSEYVLWRKKWECKGFGFTLRTANDFKLEDFYAGSPETFEPYYGERGDGNVYYPENLRSLQKFVLANTDNKGVHFMMADGGFSVEGRENEQEIISKRLYLCQFHIALSIVRTGGHFVCKLFDLFTPFSVGLVYLMRLAFERVCIFKPNTSRPANSERYLVCECLREGSKPVAHYMYEVNEELERLTHSAPKRDIREVVPLALLKADADFYDYIRNSNDRLGARQIIHLDKIRVFAKNSELHDDRQADLRKDSLKLWDVPDQVRSAPKRPDPDSRYKELMKDDKLNWGKSREPQLLTEDTLKHLSNVFDFHCVVCGESKDPSLFISLGRTHIFHLDVKTLKWSKIEANLELPADTLFYGELILELKGEGRAQRKLTSLHILDILQIGEKDVRHMHFKERMVQAEKLARAVSKPSRTDYVPLRVKKVWNLKDVDKIYERLSLKFTKNCQVPRLCYELGDGKHIIPTGLLIFKTTADDWMTAFSKSTKQFYYYNVKTHVSEYSRKSESIADFKSCFEDRVLWGWRGGVRLIPEQPDRTDDSLLQGQQVEQFVRAQHAKITRS